MPFEIAELCLISFYLTSYKNVGDSITLCKILSVFDIRLNKEKVIEFPSVFSRYECNHLTLFFITTLHLYI